MHQSDISSGGSKGTEWKEVTDGDDTWTQTTFHVVSCKSLYTQSDKNPSPQKFSKSKLEATWRTVGIIN
jgi:hypothetical protein